jgi:hypothetical protein
MQISVHKHPVNFWFIGVTLSTSHDVLSTLECTTEYQKNVTLITGCEDQHIYRFTSTNGSLKSEKKFTYVTTCVVESSSHLDLIVGTTVGITFSPLSSPKQYYL